MSDFGTFSTTTPVHATDMNSKIRDPGNALKTAYEAHAGSGDIHANLPTGVIVMWSGAIGSIPAGWALCNGSNGTPDLRDRFIVGAGSSYSIGDTGGESTVTLSEAEMPEHNHSNPATGSSGSHQHNTISAHDHTVPDTSETGDHQHPEDGVHTHTVGLHYAGVGTNPSWRTVEAESSATTQDEADYAETDIHPTGSDKGAHQHASAGDHVHTIGDTGEAGGHQHTNDGTAHTHTQADTGDTGGDTAHENKPPYYALAYIMKT